MMVVAAVAPFVSPLAVMAQSVDVVEVGRAGVMWIADTNAPGETLILHGDFALTADTGAASARLVRLIAAASSAGVERQEIVRICRGDVCHLPEGHALLVMGKPRIYGRQAEVLIELWRNAETTRFKGTGASAIHVRLFLKREHRHWAVVRAEIQDMR